MTPNTNLLIHSSPRFLALYLGLVLFVSHYKSAFTSNSIDRPRLFGLLLAFAFILLYSILGLICLSNSCPSDHLSSQLSHCSSYLAYLLIDFTSSRTLYSYLSQRRVQFSRRLTESFSHLLHFFSSIVLNLSLFLPPALESSFHLAISALLSASSLLPCIVYLSNKMKPPTETSPVSSSPSLFFKLFILNQTLALVFAVTSFWPELFDTLGGMALILRSFTCRLMLSEYQKLHESETITPSVRSTVSSEAYPQPNQMRSRSHSDSTIRGRPKQNARPERSNSYPYPRGRFTASPAPLNSPSEDFLTLRDPFASPTPPTSPISPTGNGRPVNYPNRPQMEQKGPGGPPKRKRPRRGTVTLPPINTGMAQGPIVGGSPASLTYSPRQQKYRNQIERGGVRYSSSSSSFASQPEQKFVDDVDTRFLQQLLFYSISNGNLGALPVHNQ